MAEKHNYQVKIGPQILRCCVAAALLITSCPKFTFSQDLPGVLMEPGWVLVPSLSDEFNDSVIDPKKWTWAPPWGTFHGQVATSMACLSQIKDNRREEGGSLKLSATNRSSECKSWDGKRYTRLYTVGGLYSKDTIRYGYFEIRMKIPPFGEDSTVGFGPNFWMWHLMPYDDGVWSEIDIYEFDASQNRHTCNVHYESPGMEEHWALRTDDSHDIPWMDFRNQWHIFACEWSAEKISFFHNGQLIRSTTMHTQDQKFMNLIVDINVPAVNFLYKELGEHVAWPYVYEVDYIRTFQKAELPVESRKRRRCKIKGDQARA
jgi:beta-glucanase (GH16 family)